MRAASRFVLVSLAAFCATCGSDEPTAPPETSLVGTWNATKIEFVSVANSSDRVDLIDEGASGTLTLNADKTYALSYTIPGEGTQSVSGTWSSTDVLTLNLPPVGEISGEWQFDTTLSGDTLTLVGADTSWDFDGDGSIEDAKFNLTFVRA